MSIDSSGDLKNGLSSLSVYFNRKGTSDMQMEKDMKELKRQRDYAQSQLEVERKSQKEHEVL